MKLKDWPEAVQGYVSDSVDWFDPVYEEQQQRQWTLVDWQGAVRRRRGLYELIRFLGEHAAGAGPLYPTEPLIDVLRQMIAPDPDNGVMFVRLPEAVPLGGIHRVSAEVLLMAATRKNGSESRGPVDWFTASDAFEMSVDLAKSPWVRGEAAFRKAYRSACRARGSLSKDDLIRIHRDHAQRIDPETGSLPFHHISVTPFAQGPSVLVRVDLGARNKDLIAAFAAWLEVARDELGSPEPAPRPTQVSTKRSAVTRAILQHWINWRVLQRLDFRAWRLATGRDEPGYTKLTGIVFPEPDRCPVDLRSDSYRRECDWLLTEDAAAHLRTTRL